MKITVDTKIAALLKKDPAALDAIVAIDSKFDKLKNPILRRLMAGRTSIAQAARIGNVPVNVFFKALAPLGFEADGPETAATKNNPVQGRPAYLQQINPNYIHQLDVRPVLETGKDPLQLIMKEVSALPEKHVLQLINSFEPTPLVALLEKKGYTSHAEWADENTTYTFFWFTGITGTQARKAAAPVSPDDWVSVLNGFGNRLITIDVRQLEMPKPMLTILDELKKLPGETALYVYHKRVPVYLIDELTAKNYEYRFKTIQEGEVHLLIWKMN